MAALKKVSVSKLRRSLKTTLDTTQKAIAVTRKETDVAVIMSPKYYNEILSLLKFAEATTDR